jgi:hypothetical protein
MAQSARKVALVAAAILAGPAVILVNQPTGDGEVVGGQVVGVCGPADNRVDFGKLRCTVELRDGFRTTFVSPTPQREGTPVRYLRSPRRLYGYAYSRLPTS